MSSAMSIETMEDAQRFRVLSDAETPVLIGKKFLLFAKALETGDGDAPAMQEELLALLADFEMDLTETALLAARHHREREAYKERRKHSDKALEDIKSQLGPLQKEHKAAQEQRERMEEYDVLKGKIAKLPSREDTTAALESLKGEISELDSKLGDINTEVQGQQKKFALLSHAINLLKEGNEEPPVAAISSSRSASSRKSSSSSSSRKRKAAAAASSAASDSTTSSSSSLSSASSGKKSKLNPAAKEFVPIHS